MTDTLQRLTDIAREIEEHCTRVWLLERERDELRAQLRRSLSVPAAPLATTASSPGVSRGEGGFFADGERDS